MSTDGDDELEAEHQQEIGPQASHDDQDHQDDEHEYEHPRSHGWLDSGSGHGSQTSSEDWVRANQRSGSHDGRASTRTTFYPEDASTKGPGQAHRPPSERRSWGDLAKWNDGMYSDISRGGKNFEADKRRWLDTFAGHLECGQYHRARTQHILENMDMGPFMGARIPVECVILGVLSLVIDRDVDEFNKRAIEREEMQQLLDDLELGRRELVRTRHHLRRNTSDLLEPDTDGSYNGD